MLFNCCSFSHVEDYKAKQMYTTSLQLQYRTNSKRNTPQKKRRIMMAALNTQFLVGRVSKYLHTRQ